MASGVLHGIVRKNIKLLSTRSSHAIDTIHTMVHTVKMEYVQKKVFAAELYYDCMMSS